MFYNAFAFNQDLGDWCDADGLLKSQDFAHTACDQWDDPVCGADGLMTGDCKCGKNEVYQMNDESIRAAVTALNSGESTATYGRIACWDTSKVTDMSDLFNYAYTFNQEIGNWNVSSVTDMRAMFDGAKGFNHDIGNWDVSAVTDMSKLFREAAAFNQDISNWDVGAETKMEKVFFGARVFNQGIGDWDVSAVTTFLGMFYNAQEFNQDLNWCASPGQVLTDAFIGTACASDILSLIHISEPTRPY